MKHLYAPWRSRYIIEDITPEKKSSDNPCVFCMQFADNQDEKNFIIKRYTQCVVMLNLHPYNAGHLMILPYTHTGTLDKLDQNTRRELIDIISLCMQTVTRVLQCDGVNMGMNQDKAAGGSIPEHLHIHVLPRWWGDTNFLAALADTKTISFDLHDMYKKLREAFI